LDWFGCDFHWRSNALFQKKGSTTKGCDLTWRQSWSGLQCPDAPLHCGRIVGLAGRAALSLSHSGKRFEENDAQCDRFGILSLASLRCVASKNVGRASSFATISRLESQSAHFDSLSICPMLEQTSKPSGCFPARAYGWPVIVDSVRCAMSSSSNDSKSANY
jgi:hypothetical protein